VLELPFPDRDLSALKAAVKGVIDEHARDGLSILHLAPDALRGGFGSSPRRS
jgi:hypothetical protein